MADRYRLDELGPALQRARARRGATLEVVAAKLGTDVDRLTRFETGELLLPVPVARAFGDSIRYTVMVLGDGTFRVLADETMISSHAMSYALRRRDLGLSIDSLARAVAVDVVLIDDFEAGRRPELAPATMAAIEHVLGLETRDVVGAGQMTGQRFVDPDPDDPDTLTAIELVWARAFAAQADGAVLRGEHVSMPSKKYDEMVAELHRLRRELAKRRPRRVVVAVALTGLLPFVHNLGSAWLYEQFHNSCPVPPPAITAASGDGVVLPPP